MKIQQSSLLKSLWDMGVVLAALLLLLSCCESSHPLQAPRPCAQCYCLAASVPGLWGAGSCFWVSRFVGPPGFILPWDLSQGDSTYPREDSCILLPLGWETTDNGVRSNC